jgi:hypothetical protein
VTAEAAAPAAGDPVVAGSRVGLTCRNQSIDRSADLTEVDAGTE